VLETREGRAQWTLVQPERGVRPGAPAEQRVRMTVLDELEQAQGSDLVAERQAVRGQEVTRLRVPLPKGEIERTQSRGSLTLHREQVSALQIPSSLGGLPALVFRVAAPRAPTSAALVEPRFLLVEPGARLIQREPRFVGPPQAAQEAGLLELHLQVGLARLQQVL